MGKLNAAGLFKNIRTGISKHCPEILTGIGIAGMVATTILAVKATPKAIRLIEEEKQRIFQDDPYGDFKELSKVEVIKTTWKCYIPAVVTGVTSIGCLIGASSVNSRRTAALATAYNLSKTALAEYKDKVVEQIGEKREKDIRDSVAKDKIERNPVTNTEVIVTERGTSLCYDGIFGRYFRSDRDTINKAVNTINRRMITGEMYVSLNEFYDEIGLSHVVIGDELGWNIDDGTIEIEYSSQLADDGTPCMVIGYNVAPKYNYSKFF